MTATLPDVSATAPMRTGFARTDDGLELYWRALGTGQPVVCCNGVGVSTFFWKYIALHLRDRYQVILWDYRGHGLSTAPRDPMRADLSMVRNARDMFTVMDAIGVTEPAILLGHSMGCQVILEAHHLAPHRVRALIPMFGTYAKPIDTFMDFSGSRAIFEVIHRTASAWGRSSFRFLLPLYASPFAFAFGRTTGMVDRYYAAKVDMDHYMDHLVHIDPRVFLGMVDHMASHDLTSHLKHIHVPVLVFGGERDVFTPLHRSRKMAELIPDAELSVVADGSHAAIVEHPEAINRRIDRFLAERVER